MGKTERKELDKFIEEQLYYRDLPGLCIAVRAGDFSYIGTAGYSNYEKRDELNPETIFHMASVSKLFTGTAVMQLCERGKLSAADRLCDVLTWFRMDDRRYKEITIEDMLTHTSGIADVEDYHWNEPQLGEDALEKYVQSSEVTSRSMLWGPDEKRFSYSNIAYEILGCVIAETAGMSFEQYIKENIFMPLGMESSEFMTAERVCEGIMPSLPELAAAGCAMPHRKDEERHIILCDHYPYNRAHAPSSTLTTNARDIGRWADANLRQRILGPQTYETMWRPYATIPNNKEKMGLSWFMRRQHGYTLMGHEGTDDGFRASFWICPELDCYTAVMTDISKGPVKRINKKLFSLLTGNVS